MFFRKKTTPVPALPEPPLDPAIIGPDGYRYRIVEITHGDGHYVRYEPQRFVRGAWHPMYVDHFKELKYAEWALEQCFLTHIHYRVTATRTVRPSGTPYEPAGDGQ